MFSGFSKAETKIAVLEERLTSYEIMMRRIDEAIQIMGKTSQNISKMLAVHEEKLEHNSKSDDIIVSMINDMKEENKENYLIVEKKIAEVEKKLEDVIKFRWLIAGGIIFATFIVSQQSFFVDILTPNPTPVRIERPK